MRTLLALIILLLGIVSAVPEPDYASLFGDGSLGDGSLGDRSLVEIEASTSRGDRLNVAALQVIAISNEEPRDEEPVGMAPGKLDFGIVEPAPSPVAAPAETNGAAEQPSKASLDTLCNALLTAAEDNYLPVPFFANLIWQESRLQEDSVSSKGALGIAQFMPETAAESGLANPFDPLQAIPASARLLRALRDQFGNLGFAAAAYNAGAHRIADWLQRGKALPQETRDYVVRVTGRSAQQWRTTPPEDAALTLVHHMPCRDQPAFAELEQVQAAQIDADQLAKADTKPVETAQTDTAAPKVATAKNKESRLAENDVAPGKRHAKRARLESREEPKARRTKKLAELKPEKRRLAAHHAGTHRA